MTDGLLAGWLAASAEITRKGAAASHRKGKDENYYYNGASCLFLYKQADTFIFYLTSLLTIHSLLRERKQTIEPKGWEEERGKYNHTSVKWLRKMQESATAEY